MKEPDKSLWEDSYKNKSNSGIEIRDKDGKLVNFIIVKHDEILENNTPHRITVKLDENAQLVLPPPQTFEEIIQAKRRYQMLLYGSGNSSSSSSAIITGRTARRVAAARHVAAAAAAASSSTSLARGRSITGISSRRLGTNRGKNIRGKSTNRGKRRPPKQVSKLVVAAENQELPSRLDVIRGEEIKVDQSKPSLAPQPQPQLPSQPTATTQQPTSTETREVPKTPPTTKTIHEQNACEPTPSTSCSSVTSSGGDSGASSSLGIGGGGGGGFSSVPTTGQGLVVTSLRDLNNKDNPLLKSVDAKEVKMLLKSAQPGASIVLSNGTVIKKSRRGGARAGAGRKRSRPPVDLNQQLQMQMQLHQQQQQQQQQQPEQQQQYHQPSHNISHPEIVYIDASSFSSLTADQQLHAL